jgi:hypothetical protein
MINMTINGEKRVCSTSNDDTLKASLNSLLVGVEKHLNRNSTHV